MAAVTLFRGLVDLPATDVMAISWFIDKNYLKLTLEAFSQIKQNLEIGFSWKIQNIRAKASEVNLCQLREPRDATIFWTRNSRKIKKCRNRISFLSVGVPACFAKLQYRLDEATNTKDSEIKRISQFNFYSHILKRNLKQHWHNDETSFKSHRVLLSPFASQLIVPIPIRFINTSNFWH